MYVIKSGNGADFSMGAKGSKCVATNHSKFRVVSEQKATQPGIHTFVYFCDGPAAPTKVFDESFHLSGS